jgi:hypothetical protein
MGGIFGPFREPPTIEGIYSVYQWLPYMPEKGYFSGVAPSPRLFSTAAQSQQLDLPEHEIGYKALLKEIDEANNRVAFLSNENAELRQRLAERDASLLRATRNRV